MGEDLASGLSPDSRVSVEPQPNLESPEGLCWWDGVGKRGSVDGENGNAEMWECAEKEEAPWTTSSRTAPVEGGREWAEVTGFGARAPLGEMEILLKSFWGFRN